MSKPFDLMGLFAGFAADAELPLDDPSTAEAFLTKTRTELDKALTDPTLLHGQRIEAMFEALVVSLGHFKLLKREDTGRVLPNGTYRAPDFRVVLTDGTQWLVEVKSVYVEEPSKQKRRIMSAAYLQEMQAYAAATGAILKVAVYWARWGFWTLVSPAPFIDAKGRVSMRMEEATRFDELSRLGDRSIGTVAPLKLLFLADEQKPHTISEAGEARFTIGEAKFFSGDTELLDPADRELAWIFVEYGEWEEQETAAIVEDGELVGIEFSWEPVEKSDLNFDFVGKLSRMFSRYYATRTMEDKRVVQIQAPHRPGWLSPLINAETRRALPLWIFEQRLASEVKGFELPR